MAASVLKEELNLPAVHSHLGAIVALERFFQSSLSFQERWHRQTSSAGAYWLADSIPFSCQIFSVSFIQPGAMKCIPVSISNDPSRFFLADWKTKLFLILCCFFFNFWIHVPGTLSLSSKTQEMRLYIEFCWPWMFKRALQPCHVDDYTGLLICFNLDQLCDITCWWLSFFPLKYEIRKEMKQSIMDEILQIIMITHANWSYITGLMNYLYLLAWDKELWGHLGCSCWYSSLTCFFS